MSKNPACPRIADPRPSLPDPDHIPTATARFLEVSSFVHLETLDSPPNHQVRLNWLPDPARFFAQLASMSSEKDAEDLRKIANDFFNRFKDYKIASVTLLDMPMNDVAPIFERINSKGTPLTIVDLMRAATWSDTFDLVESIQGILDVIEQKDFGGIDRRVILRSFSAAAGGGFSESSIDGLRKYGSEKLKETAQKTKFSFERAVDFLSTDLGVPTDRQVPYANQLVLLAEIFRLLPQPNAQQRLKIKQWFWRTAASGYFSGWNTGSMAADQVAVQQFAAGQAEALASGMSNPGVSVWLGQQFRSNTAHAKVLSLLLGFNGPVDLLTGQAIDVTSALHHTNSKEYHHFFPRDWLMGKGIPTRKINSLSNFIMLTAASNKKITNRAPSDYLRDVEVQLGENLKNALERNLISDGAYTAALQDNYDEFLQERAKTIASRVKELTGW